MKRGRREKRRKFILDNNENPRTDFLGRGEFVTPQVEYYRETITT
jgi:hypothetical protein